MTPENITIVPAAPGSVALFVQDDERSRVIGFTRVPVVAWRVEVWQGEPGGEYSTRTLPVLVHDWGEPHGIGYPGGRVEIEGNCFPSEAAAIAYMNAR